MKKLNKKGFTLTEMIVVIAIIGILAAVLIPSVVIYVQRAQRSNDEQLAASMTDEIERYCIENNIDQEDLLGTDIRTILLFKDYDLSPSRNKWTYVYSAETKTVTVTELSTISVQGNSFIDPTNYKEGHFLLGLGDSVLEKTVAALCKIQTPASYSNARALAQPDAGASKLVEFFNPVDTLFISNSKVFAGADSSVFKKVVYTEKTVHIPNFLGSDLYGKNDLEFEFDTVSAIIKTIEKDSELSALFPRLKVMDESNLIMLNDQFMDNLDELLKEYEDENLVIESNPSFILGDSLDSATNVTMDFIPIEEKNGVNGQPHIIIRFTISYYNENGLFARGVSQYAQNNSSNN